MCLLIFHTLLLYILSGLILPFCIDSSIVNGGRGGGGRIWQIEGATQRMVFWVVGGWN